MVQRDTRLRHAETPVPPYCSRRNTPSPSNAKFSISTRGAPPGLKHNVLCPNSAFRLIPVSEGILIPMRERIKRTIRG
jgi:hypothetical protein